MKIGRMQLQQKTEEVEPSEEVLERRKEEFEKMKERLVHYQECKRAVLDVLYDYFCELSKTQFRTSEVVATAKVLLDEYRKELK